MLHVTMRTKQSAILLSLLLVVASFDGLRLASSARLSATDSRLEGKLEAGQDKQALPTSRQLAEGTGVPEVNPLKDGKEDSVEEELLGAEEEPDLYDYEDAVALTEEMGVSGEEDYDDTAQPDPDEFLEDNMESLGSSEDPIDVALAIHNDASATLSKPGSTSSSISQTVNKAAETVKDEAGNSTVSPVMPSIGGTSYSAEAIEKNNQGKAIQDPMPGSHSSMSSTAMSTEKSGNATASEGSTLTSLARTDKPVKSDELDSSLAAEMATEAARLEEGGDPKPRRNSTPEDSKAAGLDLESANKSGALASAEDESAYGIVELGSFGDNLQSSATTASKQQHAADETPMTMGSLNAMAGGPDVGNKSTAASNSSLLAQGAALGSAVRDMVSNNASNINGTAAVVLALVAAIAVACVGLCLYRRCRGGQGKPSPRIIEISSLTRGSKSPSYSRVTGQNKEQRSSEGGGKWEDWDSDSWETLDSARNLQHKAKDKNKKAWDWDNDF